MGVMGHGSLARCNVEYNISDQVVRLTKTWYFTLAVWTLDSGSYHVIKGLFTRSALPVPGGVGGEREGAKERGSEGNTPRKAWKASWRSWRRTG